MLSVSGQKLDVFSHTNAEPVTTNEGTDSVPYPYLRTAAISFTYPVFFIKLTSIVIKRSVGLMIATHSVNRFRTLADII